MWSSVNSAAASAKQVTDGGEGAKCVSIVQQISLTTSFIFLYIYIFYNSDFIFNCEFNF